MSVLSKERLTDYIEKQKICDYIQGWINPYGKPFDGTVYEFGLKIMDYIKNSSCDEDTEELKQYRDLEEQGLLLRLPCKIGDKVYAITRDFVSEYTICNIEVYNEGFFFNWKCEKGIYINIRGFTHYQIGVDIFLTQSEAEEKLRELNKESEE